MTRHSRPAQSTTDDADQDAPSAAPSRVSGSGWSYLFSVGLVLAGIAIASLPVFLPQYAWIAKGLAKHGMTSGPLLVAGCVLFGVAWMLRMQAPAPAPEPVHDDRRELILDQLATELAQMRGGIQELRVEFVYLKDAQQSLVQVQSAQNAESQGEAQQAAIFRLAASLDQVGARDRELGVAAPDLLAERELTPLELGVQPSAFCQPRSQPQPTGCEPCESGNDGGEDRHEGDGP